MPADYAKIRDENIARYGWDTAVLDLLGHLYSERTHFIYELVQNAEDAGATKLRFELFPGRLEVSHDGRPFTEDDVRGICGVARTTKTAELTTIGQFGIGFKAVYAYTRTPRVYSPGEQFRIDNYVRPAAIEPPAQAPTDTRFVFPFDLDSVPPEVAEAEIAAALSALDPGILLFLRGITRIQLPGAVIERRTEPGPGPRRRVRLAKGGHATDWLVWSRPLDRLGHAGRQVEVAFQANGQIVAQANAPLVVYFPTEKETSLGFLVHGPFRTTPARDNVPAHDPANQALVKETAVLLTEVLADLRASGLLTVAALQALPLDPARFPAGSMFRPLFDAVRGALAGGELIPAAGGGHRAARDLRLCDEPALRGLLGPDQLGHLAGAGQPLWFADERITETGTPLLWRYLSQEIGIPVLTPAGFAARLDGGFLAAQPDEWIARLYGFLDGYPSLCRESGPARDQPIIRLAGGSQVPAFGPAGQPAVYLPGPAPSGPAPFGLPTVRAAIAGDPAARHFLTGLGLAEPDLVAEVLDGILPRYADELDVDQLDPVQHAADLECIMTALDQAPAGSRSRLLDQLQPAAFLVGENAGTGVKKMKPPGELYQRSRELEAYFDGNPDAWFAADGYGPWLMQLREMGVRAEVRLRARAADPLGYVVTADEFARHERGVDGFDPGAELDGLEFALREPGPARSEYVWNLLLVPHRELVAGVVETSVHDGFRDASRETVRSVFGAVAAAEAWLPGPDGRFRRPGELSLDDLPPAYRRDETLARALGMSQPAVAEAARQLGIPPDVLWGLSAHPDLVALIQRELRNRPETGPAERAVSDVLTDPGSGCPTG